MSKYLGDVSAYAYAVSKGYTGTEEEFAQLMADLGDTVYEFEHFSAQATTLPADEPATASYRGGVLSLGIPQGPGPTGAQVYSAVDSWINAHPETVTTVDFSIVTKVFDTVSAMIADPSLKANDNVCTKGYYEDGDNGGSNYQVSSTHSGVFYVELENGLYANRIDESGVLKAEAIGIKAYSAETENPDQSDMDRNVTIANLAIYNGIRIVFGRGYFYFSDCIRLARKGTYTLRGIDRDLSHLVFPSSDGLYFSDPIYYNYYVITGLNIHSYGHCIRCAEDCLTVLDSHFEWLNLTSDTGDCFHAPNYNVAKYVSQGGSTVYDTCVQNCVFDFVNASAPNGAAFCNIMGMYTYYMHMNLVSCLYGFRNCDGNIKQLNTLGTSIQYFIYYDKANSHSLRWKFEDTNAEGLSGAFIYSEPIVNPPSGEDSRKPETANLADISHFTAINSSFSIRGVTGLTVFPITVHAIYSIFLVNSSQIIVPSAYPGSYDTSVVTANMLFIRGTRPNYYGGNDVPEITIKSGTSGNNKFKFSGMKARSGIVPDVAPYVSYNTVFPPKYDAIYAPWIFGGKAQDAYRLNASDMSGSSLIQSDVTHRFCDEIIFTVDQSTNKTIERFLTTAENSFPGRMVTFIVHKNSQASVSLSKNANGAIFGIHSTCQSAIVIPPGHCVHFMLTYDRRPSDNAVTMTWKPFLASDDSIIAQA